MKLPTLPPNELERLHTLFSLQILDTEQEQVYDDITHIASNIMGSPIALITLIDSERNWFKSKIGITASEAPRDISFCAHTILTPQEVMIINDATKDDRFSDNPHVIGGMGVKFYFGIPLVTSNNQAIGTLCTIDTSPKPTPDDKQIDSLKALSRMVVSMLELRGTIIKVHSEIEGLQSYTLSGGRIEKADVYNDLISNCDLLLSRVKARRKNIIKKD